MANEAHKIKLLVLWDILCKNTDENHALNTDEISELLALRGLNVSRKILVQDIATLCDNGYDVLSYKKKYHYYYVVNRSLETAEVVMLADVINASKLPVAQKKALAQRLAETLCTHQAESISKHIISLDKGRRGNSSFIYNVDAIERAINENKQISFLYFNYDEKHKKVYRKNGNRYTVSPAFMVWNKDNYYLLCFSKGHDDIVTYIHDGKEVQNHLCRSALAVQDVFGKRTRAERGKTLSDDAQNRDTGVACVPYLRERLRTVFMGNSAVPYRRNRTNKGLGIYI